MDISTGDHGEIPFWIADAAEMRFGCAGTAYSQTQSSQIEKTPCGNKTIRELEKKYQIREKRRRTRCLKKMRRRSFKNVSATHSELHSKKQGEGHALLDQAPLQCPILNCQIQFKEVGKFNLHMQEFLHSPLYAELAASVKIPSNCACPECGEDFPYFVTCISHMKSENHNKLYGRPIRLAGYGCPQCLRPFESQEACTGHMEEQEHTKYAFPFKGDLVAAAPFPFPKTLYYAFLESCRFAHDTFRVHCVDCGMQLVNTQEYHQHIQDSNTKCPSKQARAISIKSMKDVFDNCFNNKKTKTCTTCKFILKSSLAKKSAHKCLNGLKGSIVDNDCTTFHEFALRLGLIKANLKVSRKDNSIHTSQDATSQSPNLKKGTKRKYPSVPDTDENQAKRIKSTCTDTVTSVKQDQATFRKQLPSIICLDDDESSVFSDGPGKSVLNSLKAGKRRRSSMPSVICLDDDEGIINNKAKRKRNLTAKENGKIDPHVAASKLLPTYLATMRVIIFLDIDNFPKFFERISGTLPWGFFVLGFYGGRTNWKEPSSTLAYRTILKNNCFFHERCGSTKDAADFAICVQATKLNIELPVDIPFKLISGDRGFCEFQKRISFSRICQLIDPHKEGRQQTLTRRLLEWVKM